MTADPYASAAHRYLEAGWSPIPLPPGAKSPPPDGYTGTTGRPPTEAEVDAWTRDGPHNIALRLAADVVGIDVDHRGDKRGADELADLEARLGPLPPTVSSTARGTDDGPGLSRILLYRVPAGTRLRAQVAPAIEAIQRHHRYVVCAPSTNPHAGGARYRWYDDAGEPMDRPPEPDELADLPWPWLEELRSVGGGDNAEAAAPEEVRAFLDTHTEKLRPAALDGIRTRLAAWRPGQCRHDTAVEVACWATREAAAGLYPAAEAVEVLRSWWRRVLADDERRRDGPELDDAIAWAIAQADADPDRVAAIRADAEPPPGEDTDDERRGPGRPSVATVLVRMAEEKYRFTTDDTGRGFAIPLDGPALAIPLEGARGDLAGALADLYYATTGTAPKRAAITDALGVLAGRARAADPERLWLRVARTDAGIVVDLGRTDGAAVLVTAAGWQVIDRAPVTFRRTELTGELPMPEAVGADLFALLAEVLNVTDADRDVLAAWLVAVHFPDLPVPVMLLTGLQGAGKSTAARYIVGTVDPSPAPLRSAPRDLEQWVVAAAGSRVVAVDNISTIPDWFSDAICRAATGDALVKRRLYSDDALAVVTLLRAVMLTSIDPGALRGDLVERLLMVELETIPTGARRTVADLDAGYDAARPRLLGATLDLLAQVLGVLDTIDDADLARMADFSRICAAVDRVTGRRTLARYHEQAANAAADLVAGDPLAAAILELLEAGPWSGTAEELRRRLEVYRPRESRFWPTTARKLSAVLDRLAPALGSVGVIVERGERTRHGRRLALYTAADNAECVGRVCRDGLQSLIPRKLGEEGADAAEDFHGYGAAGPSQPTHRHTPAPAPRCARHGCHRPQADGCGALCAEHHAATYPTETPTPASTPAPAADLTDCF